MKNIKNKTALITGAGGGLGSAIARQLAGQGCHLALVDINDEALQKLAAEIAGDKNNTALRISLHHCDLGDADAVEALRETVVAEHGGLDILINNAGITLQKSAMNHSLADWRRVFNVNWWGTVNCCHVFMPILAQASGANIVNLSSMAAYHGLPSQASYCASKAAVQAYSESLTAEVGHLGVNVCHVHPGAIKTDMMLATMAEAENRAAAQRNYQLVSRFGVPADVAAQRIVRAILSDQKKLNIGADARLTEFAVKLFPGAVQRLLGNVYRKTLVG